MISYEVKRCSGDRDYAELSRFYLKNCRDFDDEYMLQDGLLYLISTISDSQFLLYLDSEGRLIGLLQYHWDPEFESVFIDSAILAKELRSSRFFYTGLRDMVTAVREDYPEGQALYFYALATNRYTNRLYHKFAEFTEVRERNGRRENLYTADMARLSQYLKLHW